VNLKAVPLMLGMIPSLFRGVSLLDLERIKAIAREAYPQVAQLSTDKLSQWLQGGRQTPILLVDVRAPEEFAVSHLQGAVNLRKTAQIMQTTAERKATTTILYCSVGFRSSRIAHRMTQQGARDVFNLEGSIFQWANERRPIFQGETIVQQVHPYGRRWAGLLEPGVAWDC